MPPEHQTCSTYTELSSYRPLVYVPSPYSLSAASCLQPSSLFDRVQVGVKRKREDDCDDESDVTGDGDAITCFTLLQTCCAKLQTTRPVSVRGRRRSPSLRRSVLVFNMLNALQSDIATTSSSSPSRNQAANDISGFDGSGESWDLDETNEDEMSDPSSTYENRPFDTNFDGTNIESADCFTTMAPCQSMRSKAGEKTTTIDLSSSFLSEDLLDLDTSMFDSGYFEDVLLKSTSSLVKYVQAPMCRMPDIGSDNAECQECNIVLILFNCDIF